jgi:molybdopterin/thiamine biosynthesis adenylyltransferase
MKGISIGNRNRKWGEEVFSLLSWFDEKKVKNASVMVVGAGALGNEVVKNLALFGIGNIMIVDFDTVEHSNLCRSVLFRPEDAESNAMKAEVAAKRIREINPYINVNYIAGDIGTDVGLGHIRKMDLVIGCLDSRLARYLINRNCFRANKTWIDGGIENLEGNVRIFTPGVNCYECSLNEADLEMLFYRTGCPDIAKINVVQGRVATTPISSSIIGAIQTQEALKFIHGFNENSEKFKCNTLNGKMLKYDGMYLTMKSYKIEHYEEECMSHDVWEPVVRADELSANHTVGHTLKILSDMLGSDDIMINLMNNKLIYQLVPESTDEEINVIIPESKVAGFIEENNITKDPRERIFQRFYESIDESFPYPDMTLREIGIPLFDVLNITAGSEVHYIELSGDETD